MSFEAMLAVRAFESGRAQRTARYRHRAITQNPLAIVAFELGAEPYVVGAIALGRQGQEPQLSVPGQPIDRRLLFHALVPFARQFCEAFEAPLRGEIERVEHRGSEIEIPVELPQVIVANEQTIKLLSRLGRRLAYLKLDGPTPADPALPRLGKHLMWLTRHARIPGQQLLLPLSQFLRDHWATAMSSYESGSLAALEAWINPPHGSTGAEAAAEAEANVVGPALSPSDAQQVSELMEIFDRHRARSIDPQVYEPFLGPLQNLYRTRTHATWNLIWKAVARERAIPAAASVAARERLDRIEYARHMQWMNGPVEGRVRARTDLRQNIQEKRRLEEAKARVEAQEAIDDPIRMIPQIVKGSALAGEVVILNDQRREMIGARRTLRPSITLRTDEPCLMPLGSELWWTVAADGREWQIASITPFGAGSEVTLVLQTNRRPSRGYPIVGNRVAFTQLTPPEPYESMLPRNAPWTHRAPDPTPDELDPPDAADVAAG